MPDLFPMPPYRDEDYWTVVTSERYPYGRTLRVLRCETNGGHLLRAEILGRYGNLIGLPCVVFVPYSKRIREATVQLERAFDHYTRLNAELEALKAEYERKLAELEKA